MKQPLLASDVERLENTTPVGVLCGTLGGLEDRLGFCDHTISCGCTITIGTDRLFAVINGCMPGSTTHCQPVVPVGQLREITIELQHESHVCGAALQRLPVGR